MELGGKKAGVGCVVVTAKTKKQDSTNCKVCSGYICYQYVPKMCQYSTTRPGQMCIDIDSTSVSNYLN